MTPSSSESAFLFGIRPADAYFDADKIPFANFLNYRIDTFMPPGTAPRSYSYLSQRQVEVIMYNY
jgi:hypothetical protein